MIIKKDLNDNALYLIDNDDVVFRTDRIGAEFVLIFTSQPIIITESDDKYLYRNLSWIFNNEYVFNNNGLSYKANNEIRWFSDQSCDIENENDTDRVDRIIIKKIGESIQIIGQNPFCEKHNINKTHIIVAFSPAGNGFYSKNLTSGNTFQDDFIVAIQKSISNEFLEYNNYENNIYLKKYK